MKNEGFEFPWYRFTLATSPPPISGHLQQPWPRSMWASGWWRPPEAGGSSCGNQQPLGFQNVRFSVGLVCINYKLPKNQPLLQLPTLKKKRGICCTLYFLSLGSGKWPFKQLICSSRSAQPSYLLTLPLAWWVLSLTTANHREFGSQHIWVQINLLVRSTPNQLLVCMNAHLLITKDQPAVQDPTSPLNNKFFFIAHIR